jgi:hypothetical protein
MLPTSEVCCNKGTVKKLKKDSQKKKKAKKEKKRKKTEVERLKLMLPTE